MVNSVKVFFLDATLYPDNLLIMGAWTCKQVVNISFLQGDKLYGRGTTDCLGHVALITDLFVQLAETKPKLKHSIVAVFIAA